MIEFLEAAIRIATPLMFAALGGILSERAGVFAVGLEGMMLMGAFGGVVGVWATGSAFVGVGLAIVCGAAIGLVVAIVTVAYRADNMVTGLTANILAAGLTSYLMRVLSGGGRPIAIHLTPLPAWPIPGLADIPVVGPLLFALPPLTYLAIVGCVALAFFLGRTQAGLTLRATGESPETVLASGAEPFRVRMACGRGLRRCRRHRRRRSLLATGRNLHRRHDWRSRLSRARLVDRRALEPLRRGDRLSRFRRGGSVRAAYAKLWLAGQLLYRANGALFDRAPRARSAWARVSDAGRDRTAASARPMR